MPRKSRIDTPGALHHIMSRGIERSNIFQDNTDRNYFLDRLGGIIRETSTACFAWALLPNHFHLLLKTGKSPISAVMGRLLTGHAVSYNRRHRRHGHLFQNRYKSILCEEDPYFLQLVRYIHLNPIRANISDIRGLDRYPFSGHSAITGKVKRPWQDVEWVLKLFDGRPAFARRKYKTFIKEGLSQGKRDDLTGGGLIRSAGGWAALEAKRKAKIFQKSDERILGSGEFVEDVLSEAEEKMERKYALLTEGYDLERIAEKVSCLMGLKPSEPWLPGKDPKRVAARSLLCYWAVRELGISMAELSRRLRLSLSGVSLSVKRGENIAREKGYQLTVEKLEK